MTETDLPYLDVPPLLVAGSSDAAITRARQTAEAFGTRLGQVMRVDDVRGRLDRQASASALWIELDDLGASAEDFISAVNCDVRAGRYPVIVAASASLVDPLAALLDDDVQLLIDASEAERTAALAVAFAGRDTQSRYSDIASDRNAERLRQLSDEVSRIASTLARLSAGPGAPPRPVDRGPVADVPQVAADTVRSVIRARRLRARFFSEELFADPAWDMLLDLLQAEISQLRVPVSSLCIAAAVPATTALRWLKTMVKQGIFVRRADPHDGRRVFVELAPQASQALRRYFAEVASVPVI